MPIVAPRANYERGFAHSHELRSPQAAVSTSAAAIPATPTPGGTEATAASNPETTLATTLPTGVKALSGLIALLGLFILGVVIWKVRGWRRHRRNPASNWVTITNEKQARSPIRIDLQTANMEKPSKAVLKPILPPASAGVGWVPQLRADINLPKPTKKRSKRVTKIWERNLAEMMASAIPEREPPPYLPANTAPLVISSVPAVPTSPPRQPSAPAPSTALKLALDDMISPPSTRKLMLSPARTSSYGPYPVHAPRRSTLVGRGDKKLPRLMNVERAFEPSMEDELLVDVGETIRLLEEYEDKWCLVQRVGRMDAEKGVIPRVCLTERPDFVPTHPGLPSAGSYRL